MSDSIDYNEQHLENVAKYKKHLISYGIFTGILVVMFALLVVVALTSRGFRVRGLRTAVQSVLADYGEYEVGDSIVLDTPVSSNCAFYYLTDNSNKDKNMCAVIVRVTTLYGPQSAVFIYNSDTRKADFIDYVNVSGRVKESIRSVSKNSQISYWQNRIPSIMGGAYGK